MNNDNKVETAIAGLNCWASYAIYWLPLLQTRYFVYVQHAQDYIAENDTG